MTGYNQPGIGKPPRGDGPKTKRDVRKLQAARMIASQNPTIVATHAPDKDKKEPSYDRLAREIAHAIETSPFTRSRHTS